MEEESRFGRFLTNVLSSVNVGVSAIEREPLAGIIALCFEGAQNIVDHANKKPFPRESLFTYLAVRYYKKLFRSDDGPLSTYIKHGSRELGTDREWIEILLNDDGVGIPGRHSQSLDIYRGRLADEEQVLELALHRSSVKVRAGDSKVRGGIAGEGFTHIRSSLRRLKAFAAIRTGRCFATFDGLASHQDRFRLNRDRFGLPLGYMPGTALHVVIPLPHARDIQQHFDLS